MSNYTPDRWVVIKIVTPENDEIYKVFASWYGGFAGSDSWQLNSGIVNATLIDNQYHFKGSSGSVYVCHKNNYGTNMYGQSVLSKLIKDAAALGVAIDILPEDTDLMELNYA